jgi:UDP-N-acetylglucosamine 2-epimerase
MEKIILIDSKEDIKKNLRIIKKHNYFPIALDFESKSLLKNKNIKFKPIDQFTPNDSHIKSMYWLKNWSDKKIHNNKSIKELTKYRKTSLWWAADFWLYYHAIHKDSIYEISLYLDTIMNIIKKEKPKRIVLSKINPMLVEVVRLITKKEKIQLGFIKNNKIKNKLNNPYTIEWLKERKFLARKIISTFSLQKIKHEAILFFTYSFNWEKTNGTSNDRFLGNLYNNLKKHKIKYVDIDYEPNIGLLKPLKRRKTHIAFEKFYSPKIAYNVSKEKRKFKKIWKELEKSNSFRNSFNYEGINIYPLIKNKLKFLFYHRLGEAIKYMQTADKLMSETSPKVLVLTDETSMYGRAIINAAKSKKIKSIGIAHGMVNPTCFEYIHKKEEIDLYPLPDQTFVFGKHTKNILTNLGNYSPSSIKIVGQSRYDFIKNDKYVPKNTKEEIFKQLNLDPAKKLVTFYSECLSDIEAGDLPNAIFNSIKKLKEEGIKINFVVKLHPREFENHRKFYENLAKKTGIKAIIVKEINVFELINASDVGIVMHSNTGLETIMLKKPLLVVNVTGKEDVFPYVEKKVAMGAYSEKEISQKIKSLLFNKDSISKLKKSRDKFIEYMLFKLDGNSSKRSRDLIEKIL